MANLKEIRNRITSVNSTMQITSAMKMVSAAKLKRAQDAIVQMRPYAEKLQELLSNLCAGLDMSEGVYAEEREVKNVLIIAVTSNRGLCGGFNNNILKEASRVMQEHAGANVKVLGVGKKAHEFFAKTDDLISGGYPELPYEVFDDLTFDNVSALAQQVMDDFVSGKIDKAVLVYNQFKNAATQIVQTEQFLPVVAPEGADAGTSIDYIFEPNKEEIVSELIPKSLKTQFYKGVLDSHAAEHGARMTAMHKATDNANELKKELSLSYNKARQAAITNEILEIVGGAEALAG